MAYMEHSTLHPVFQETIRGFVRAARSPRKLNEAELIEHYGVSPYAEVKDDIKLPKRAISVKFLTVAEYMAERTSEVKQ